jgi:hypothetical protein
MSKMLNALTLPKLQAKAAALGITEGTLIGDRQEKATWIAAINYYSNTRPRMAQPACYRGCPINQLPDELLSRLLEMVGNTRALLVVLPSVCKRWRQVLATLTAVDVSYWRVHL